MAFVYNSAAELLSENSTRINWLGDTIKGLLVTSGYTANRDHVFVDSIGANELSGTGYVAGFAGAGRKTLASKTLTANNTLNQAEFGAANLVWTGIDAGNAAACILIKEVTTDADSLLIAYLDGVTAQLTAGGQLTATFPGGLAFVLTT